MNEKQIKNIVRDVLSGGLIGAGSVLFSEGVLHPLNKFSMSVRNTAIGGLIGSTFGLFFGLIHHGRSGSKVERLAQEKAVAEPDNTQQQG